MHVMPIKAINTMKRTALTPRRKIVLFIWAACIIYAGGTLLYPSFQRTLQSMQPHSDFHGHQFGFFRSAYTDYLQEHNGDFPPMKHPKPFLAAISRAPALSGKSPQELENYFVDPNSGQPYHMNGWLSGKNISDLSNPSGVVALYEDAMLVPDARQRFFVRAVMYADGRAVILQEDKWPQIKKQSHIE